MFTEFKPQDTIVNKLDIANAQLTISTTAQANASGIWAFIANSTTSSYLYKPDNSSNSSTTVSSSASFRHHANYFFGTNTFIPDSYSPTLQRTTIRVIQVGRPVLDEGFYKNSITAVINIGSVASITAKDIANRSSEGSPFGFTASLVDGSNTGDKIGTVFYDHGVVVLHGGSGSSSAVTLSTSGFAINSTVNANEIRLAQFKFQSRNILKRSIFFCRGFNYEYNYTTNPTSRNSDGTILNSLSSNPTTFVTTVGLYNKDGVLLAIGKLSQAKKKSFSEEIIIKASVDL